MAKPKGKSRDLINENGVPLLLCRVPLRTGSVVKNILALTKFKTEEQKNRRTEDLALGNT